jgi:phosphoribosylformylglycinamidine cyclo-ligase
VSSSYQEQGDGSRGRRSVGAAAASYREAGVDQDAADALIPRYAAEAARTRRSERVQDIGGFAGLFSLEDLSSRGYKRPALALSTDTTGTKIELLRKAGLHRTAGWDCVAMNVDDVVCCGAEPMLFVDCIATERLDTDEASEIVGGVADACVEAGCELVGGETAQLPGLLAPGAYEVMGTCVGIVDLDKAWGPHNVCEGDDIVALAASGLHSNGFSLVRRVLGDDDPPQGLLAPTAIYARKLLALAEEIEIHAAVHVTGGGIEGNLPRALPDGLGAHVDLSTWERPGIYDWLSERGISEEEILATFNLGAGMLVVTPEGARASEVLSSAGVSAWVAGRVGGSAVEVH